MRRPLPQILLLLGLLLLLNQLWQNASGPLSTQSTANAGTARLPLNYIENARSRSFTADGTLSEIIEADRVEQFGRNGYAMLTQPRLYAHSANDRTWSASADRARYELTAQRLLLRRNVALVHDQTGTRMTGQAVNVYLDRREAESTSPVTITQGDNRTHAKGMLARLDQETITLGPDVESIYAPPQ